MTNLKKLNLEMNRLAWMIATALQKSLVETRWNSEKDCMKVYIMDEAERETACVSLSLNEDDATKEAQPFIYLVAIKGKSLFSTKDRPEVISYILKEV